MERGEEGEGRVRESGREKGGGGGEDGREQDRGDWVAKRMEVALIVRHRSLGC